MEISSVPRDIRSSFDLWSGVAPGDLAADISNDMGRASLQLENAWSAPPGQQLLINDTLSAADQLLGLDTADLLGLLQQQQLLQNLGKASADEQHIDAQIQRLVQLKHHLKRTKQAAVQQQQHQTILEGAALTQDALALLSTSSAGMCPAPSVDLANPLPVDNGLLNGAADLDDGWGNLAAARAAARGRSVRHSVDIGGLARHMATMELQNASSAALADSQGLDLGLVDSLTASGLASGMGSSGMDCLGGNSFTDVTSAFSAAPSRNSFCSVPPTLATLLDVGSSGAGLGTSTPPLPSPEAVQANNALALQSAFYGPSRAVAANQQAAAAVANLAEAASLSAALSAASSAGLSGLSGMSPALSVPSTMGLPSRQSIDCNSVVLPIRQSIDLRQSIDYNSMQLPPRQSLDCSGLLGPSALQSVGPVGAGPAATGLPSPSGGAYGGRPSLNLPQAPMLGDRGAQVWAQQQADAADSSWNFTARRGRASQDVRRVSSDLMRSHTPSLAHPPPRKSISSLTSASSGSGGSGRSSPGGRPQQQQGAPAAAGPSRASLDKPYMQAPKWANGTQWNPMAAVSKSSQCANKGTGVFIPTSMIKS